MKYYNNGKYEDLIITEDDLSVKESVERIFKQWGTLNMYTLAKRVQDYYYNEVGISSNRLWAVIDYYCEEVIHEQIEKSCNNLFKVRTGEESGLKVRY